MSVGAMDIAAECVAAQREMARVLKGADRLGRKQPKRLGLFVLAAAVPQLMARFKRIDAGYFDVEGGVARLWCPCLRSAPAVRFDGFYSCGCGRIFAFDGAGVWVAQASA